MIVMLSATPRLSSSIIPSLRRNAHFSTKMAKSRKGLKRVTGNGILETLLHGLADRHKRSVGDVGLYGLPNGSDVLLLSSGKYPIRTSASIAILSTGTCTQKTPRRRRCRWARTRGVEDASVINGSRSARALGGGGGRTDHRLGLPPSSATSTNRDTNWPPAIVLVQPVSQSLVFAGRARSSVIPPRMFGQAPGRGSHLPVSGPRPMRSTV